MEEWKNIPGYHGVYQVSSEGRVKAIRHVQTIRRVGVPPTIKEKIIKPYTVDKISNVRYVCLCWKGAKTRINVAHLVSMAFPYNPQPERKRGQKPEPKPSQKPNRYERTGAHMKAKYPRQNLMPLSDYACWNCGGDASPSNLVDHLYCERKLCGCE